MGKRRRELRDGGAVLAYSASVADPSQAGMPPTCLSPTARVTHQAGGRCPPPHSPAPACPLWSARAGVPRKRPGVAASSVGLAPQGPGARPPATPATFEFQPPRRRLTAQSAEANPRTRRGREPITESCAFGATPSQPQLFPVPEVQGNQTSGLSRLYFRIRFVARFGRSPPLRAARRTSARATEASGYVRRARAWRSRGGCAGGEAPRVCEGAGAGRAPPRGCCGECTPHRQPSAGVDSSGRPSGSWMAAPTCLQRKSKKEKQEKSGGMKR